ncbi:hypothetical protein CFHF_04320 [Caulobacter flavus]|uniref:Uncharacterized protein n=1 Tax=Caulobacter flavus TaxID=1679497 RepID=A0A2N5CZK2_9CAUL|nr:hypothetical protein C1707_01850 [Caulobacter flavus]PLR19233.1 hypothetical protein CFHF_04320 [Caulobacter flavus]
MAQIPGPDRLELETLVLEIGDVEIDPSNPDQWEALATVFLARSESGPDQEMALQLGALMYKRATEVRGPLPSIQ